MSNDHFVPQFYLKRWAGHDQRVAVFQNNPYKGIVCDRHTPEHTGYEEELYKDIEEQFFKPLDGLSSGILLDLEREHANTVKLFSKEYKLNEKHEVWAKFILGLIVRMPDKVGFIKEYCGNAGMTEEDALKRIPEIISNPNTINDLRKLKWISSDIQSNVPLLTCDNPLIFKPNNLRSPSCVIILPLGPHHFFLATSEGNLPRLEQNKHKMARHINKAIVMQAARYVYASSEYDVEKRFLEKNLKRYEIK